MLYRCMQSFVLALGMRQKQLVIVLFEEEICLGNVPAPAENGTFIINGVDRTIVSQAHRSSGMFF